MYGIGIKYCPVWLFLIFIYVKLILKMIWNVMKDLLELKTF